MMTYKQQQELEKMMSGDLYDATNNTTLLDLLTQTQEMCHDYNLLRPSQTAERDALMRRILGKTGQRRYCRRSGATMGSTSRWARTSLPTSIW